MDAKDILGLQKNSFPSAQDKKPRPPKEPQRKPDGVSREVINHPSPPSRPLIWLFSQSADGCLRV
jgi:hypothetical protein